MKPLKQLEEAIEDPEANPLLAGYCQWADNLEAQFACAEHLVEEGRAFFGKENLERLKSLPLSEESARFMRSVQWSGALAVSKRK